MTMWYVVEYKFPRKYGGKIQTSKFKSIEGFQFWIRERSPTIQILKKGYRRL